MCNEVNFFNESICVTYHDATGSFDRTATVENHRMFIDEYHSANGTPLDEHFVHHNSDDVVDYLQ